MAAITVYIGVGSNLGNRLENLRRGIRAIGRRVTITAASSIYETEPWGFLDQPPFLNAVCSGLTSMSALDLLELLKDAEALVGRRPTFLNGPRKFDADLLLYGGQLIDEVTLQVPHPRLAQRAFVLEPLAEIAPELVHPLEELSIRQLLDRVPGRQGVRRWSEPLITVTPMKLP